MNSWALTGGKDRAWEGANLKKEQKKMRSKNELVPVKHGQFQSCTAATVGRDATSVSTAPRSSTAVATLGPAKIFGSNGGEGGGLKGLGRPVETQ